MSFPGPLPVSPISTVAGQEIGLRVFQRVTAQVLSVTGSTAILSIDGHPVVAQLTSADQGAALSSQRTAHFVVTQLTDQGITLKFVKEDQPQAPLTAHTFNGSDLAARLLEQNNMPLTASSLMVARSLLKQHLPVTPGLLNDLLGVLSGYGAWGEAEAELAAAMKAAGLPVSAESVRLASRRPAQTGRSLFELIVALSQSAGQELPAELSKQIHRNLQTLNSMVLTAGGESDQVAEQIKESVKFLGRSLENILLEQLQNPVAKLPEKSLTMLVKLQQVLEQFGKHESAAAVNEFLAGLRQSQLGNVKPDPAPGSGVWSEIGFMIQNAQQKADEKFSAARLRIAHESKAGSNSINPAYTRLIIQVDLDANQTVEVDLSLVGKQIRASVMAPDPAWCSQAQSELPSFVSAIQSLGYAMNDAQIGVGDPQAGTGNLPSAGNTTLTTVNIEV
jgi:hypothetical protein